MPRNSGAGNVSTKVLKMLLIVEQGVLELSNKIGGMLGKYGKHGANSNFQRERTIQIISTIDFWGRGYQEDIYIDDSIAGIFKRIGTKTLIFSLVNQVILLAMFAHPADVTSVDAVYVKILYEATNYLQDEFSCGQVMFPFLEVAPS